VTSTSPTFAPVFGAQSGVPGTRLTVAAVLSLALHLTALVGLAIHSRSGQPGLELPVPGVPPGPALVARLVPMPAAEPAVAPLPVIAAAIPAPAAPPESVATAAPVPVTRGLPRPARPSMEGADVAVRTLFDAGRLSRELGETLANDYPNRPARFPGPNKALALPYPESALRDRRSGTVQVLLRLDAAGTVVATRLDPADSEFSATVRDALAELRFIPAQSGGAPVPYWIAFEVTFSIGPMR
jgi:TonB family protein